MEKGIKKEKYITLASLTCHKSSFWNPNLGKKTSRGKSWNMHFKKDS